MNPLPWLHYIDGLTVALPIAVAALLLAPGIVRDAISHLTRKDLPE